MSEQNLNWLIAFDVVWASLACCRTRNLETIEPVNDPVQLVWNPPRTHNFAIINDD